jgi:hypothetical protein
VDTEPFSEASRSDDLVRHSATVQLSEFAWSALVAEAKRQQVPVEDLLAHAAMYYLADLDSGRMAARVFRPGPAPEAPPGRFDRH